MRVGKVNEWAPPGQEINFRNIKLKAMQIAIINCNKNHCVVVNLPTGFGKSLLFQYPAAQLVDRCVVVFVPLKALLWDCLKQAKELSITSAQLTAQFVERYMKKKNTLPQLLFLTPERLFANNTVLSFLDWLHVERMIELMVIDQIHCISQWGSDFRPDYAKLCQIRKMFPNIRVLGMSATIPPEAREDLVSRLKIPGSYYFQSSSNRFNLIYEIVQTKKKEIADQIVFYLKNKNMQGQPGIIYCQTIKHSEQVYKDLLKLKMKCKLFHSKLSEKQRAETFKQFMDGECKTIIATICFGMGVNKKNIRYVINAGVSLSAENYYQESGRAGRDGNTSYCLLLTYPGDTSSIQFLICQSSKKEVLQKRRLFKVDQIKAYANSNECRKKHLFALLGQQFTPEQCKKTCDFCRKGQFVPSFSIPTIPNFQEVDYTETSKLVMTKMAGIKIQITKSKLMSIFKGSGYDKSFITQKLQSVIGILRHETVQMIGLLIDALVEHKLLLVTRKNIKNGRFSRTISLLSPCNKSQLNSKLGTVTLKKPRKNGGADNHVFKNEEVFNRFDKFISKKDKTISVDLDKRVSDVAQKYLSCEDKYQPKKGENIFKEEENKYKEEEVIDVDYDLQQIKMVSMNDNYQRFFDQIFGSSLDVDDQKELIKESEELFREKKQGGDQNSQIINEEEMIILDDDALDPVFIDDPEPKVEKETTVPQGQKDSDDDSSFNFEMIQLFKKKKEEEKKNQLKPVKRKLNLSMDFI